MNGPGSVLEKAPARRRKREVAHEEALARALEERPEATKQEQLVPSKDAPTRALFALAWPIAAAMLGETAMGLVDTKLVSGIGSEALGGVGIATTLMFLGYSVVYGTMRGVKVRTAHAVGEGRGIDGFVYARAGAVMSFLFGVVILVACRDVSPALRLLGTDPAIIPYARDFLAAVTLGAPMACALTAFVQHRQAISDSRTPMIAGITGNVFNALFAWCLIYGHLGLPALGVRGGGMATAATELLEMLALGLLLVRSERKALAALPAAEIAARPTLSRAMREVLDLGLPSGIQWGVEMLAFTAFTAVLGTIGGAQIAGHQIALAIMRVSFLPGVAVAEAASVMVGHALGARLLARADAVVKSALAIAVSFMALCGLGFALLGGPLARFFASDPEVVHVTRNLLLMAALFQVLDAVSIVLRGSLRGAKDVRMVAILGIVIIWACVPTAAWFLGRGLGLGALGGWIGFLGETTLGGVIFWLRWTRGGWRNQYA
ncbi:MAG: Multi antimicrobial extrusion protein [Labilithrix sp.]|nr:Multi antimicrobial extrusion protein [Labilithrix sp.]